jgi:outer membrane protein assembly factor BamB
VIWGERIFLTTALDNGRQRVVFCLDRNGGKQLWRQTAWSGTPEPSHKMNGWASATCVTDGEVVVAFFGRGGMHAYSLDGKPLWSRDLGPFDGPWGTAACPIIVGDHVIQNGDSESEAFLIALDKHTGKTVWSTPRESLRGWSTPIVVDAGGHREIVLNGHNGVRGYDPATGKELWFCKGYNGRGEPIPAAAHGLLYVVNGLAGDVYAVRPGGSGDVSETHRAWHTPRKAGRDLPSPIVVDNFLLVLSMNGILTCYDATTGKELWKERIGEHFSASPLAAGGLVYFQNESGETVVVRPGPQLDIVARNTVGAGSDELFRASPTPSEGQLFLRSDRFLYCIGERKPARP